MIKPLLFIPLISLLLASLALAQDPIRPVVGPAKGALVIMGGGGKDRTYPQVFAKFVELAGGKKARIVVVPTAASSDPDFNYTQSWSLKMARDLGVAEVTILHTHDRKEAETEAFAKPLTTATGVWFGGGRQWRFTKAYGRDTDREGISQGPRTRRSNRRIVGWCHHSRIISGLAVIPAETPLWWETVQKGFGFMQNTAIDQHLIARGRQKDLLKVLEDPKGKMQKEFDRTEMLGIGIDEDVAIVVIGDQFEIIGKDKGQVLVYDPKSWKKDTPDQKKWVTVNKGEKYDLAQRKVIPAAEAKK